MKKLFLLLLIFTTSSMFAQIERIEPPFWYEGMKNSELQIMFYGKNIAQFEVSVSNSISITNVKKTENPNYLFVTINTKNIKAKDCVFTFKEKNKIAFTQKYSLKKRRENSAQRQSYDASDMIYLIMPDRFANGKNENDSSIQPSKNSIEIYLEEDTVAILKELSKIWIICKN